MNLNLKTMDLNLKKRDVEINNAELSVCMIVKDEGECLEKCLDSISDIAGEIIIVDTGSVDDSIALAEKYDCNIFQAFWENDFSKARNFAISKATRPFILSIDADEQLMNPDVLNYTITSAKADIGAWLVNVESHTNSSEDFEESYIHKLPRLFRNFSGIRFEGIIHEQVTDSVLRSGLKIEQSDIRLSHDGYDSSKIDIKSKNKRNLAMLNVALEQAPDNAYLLLQRAKTYLAMKDNEAAEIDIEKSVELADKRGSVMPQALNYAALAAYKKSNFNLAADKASESDKILPGQVFANYIAGESYTAMKNFPEAYEAYRRAEKALAANDDAVSLIGEYKLPDEEIKYRIGRSLVGLKMYKEAQTVFEEIYEIDQSHLPAIVGLANVAFRSGRMADSVVLLENALILEPANKEISAFLAQARKVLKSKESTSKNSENKSANKSALLTLSMIVKNEEEMLPGCLESIKNLVDEMIIVDTGSTDKTKEIAEEFGAKVYDFEWCDDFAAARNESLKHCTGQWILYLDADERIKPIDIEKLRKMLKESDTAIGGYICTIESDHTQLNGSSEMHRGGYPRLFKNFEYPLIKFNGRVHEQITPSIFALNKSIEHSDIVIEHLGYNRSQEEMEKKIQRNYAMLIQHVQEEPLNSYAWYQLGQTLAQMRLAKEAEHAIRFALQNKGLADSVYASAAATMSQLVGNQRQFDEAIYWADKSLEKAPNQVYALNLKAHALFRKGQFADAEELFRKVLANLKNQEGIPQSGFDIKFPEESIVKSIELCRAKIHGTKE